MNALERSSTLIVMKPMRFSGRSYSPGDNFKYGRLSYAQTRKVKRLIEGPERKIAELTQASMEKALKRRENPRPPRGFTLSGLLGLNVITMAQIEEYGWSREDLDIEQGDQPGWTVPEGSWIVLPQGADESDVTNPDALWVVPFKSGGPVRYYVHNAKGERISGDASISGKTAATKWAMDYLVEQAKQRQIAGAGNDGPDWSEFSENPDEWTDEQVETFVTWFDALPEGPDEIQIDNPGVLKAFKERRDAAAADEISNHAIFGMNVSEARDFLEGLSEDDLRQFVASQQGKPVEDLAGLAAVALLDIAADIHAEKTQQEGDTDDSDIQPNPGDAA